MPRKRHSLGLIVILALGLGGIAACNPAPSVQTNATIIDSTTAAFVNGETIFISDVKLEAVAQGLVEPGSEFGTSHPDFPQVLEQLIDQRLLAQEAERRGLDRDPAAARRLAAGRERLLGNILVESLVANEVTEDAIDRMYDEQVKLQQLDDEVRIRQITVSTQTDAAMIIDELSNGREFTEAALEHSTDVRTRLEGGDLGWIKPIELEDPYAAIIGNTVTGSISEAFETEAGWIILKVDERRTTPPKTKDEMRPEIITFMTFTQISDILRELRFSADIQQRDPIEILQEAEAAEAASEAPVPVEENEETE